MSKASRIRIVALAVLVNSIAFSSIAHAQAADTPQAPTEVAQNQPMDHKQAEMARHVEDRIQTLHDKLKITEAQEAKWADVAKVMRDNEAMTGQLIHERHENKDSMTAIDDLQSYANITQSHTDGIKKLIPVFQSVYNDMSDDQKKEADKIFGSYEGHGGKMHKHHA